MPETCLLLGDGECLVELPKIPNLALIKLILNLRIFSPSNQNYNPGQNIWHKVKKSSKIG